MKDQNLHNDLSKVEEQSKAFFSSGTFRWEKSSDEIWEEMQSAISEHEGRVIVFRSRTFSYAIAAIFIFLIGMGGFFRFYSKTINVPAGEHQLVELPDGSSVQLNAQTEISYNPYWWKINRNVRFNGEAFFKVQKGKRFSVISDQGITEVLGTSFNVFSREDNYKVTCVTGSVKVTSKTMKEVTLLPDSRATVLPGGGIKVEKNITTMPDISWKDNYFQFTGVPFNMVINEIERQYNLEILVDEPVNDNFTGNFKRQENIDNVLKYVCLPLGLSYTKVSDNTYEIRRNANE